MDSLKDQEPGGDTRSDRKYQQYFSKNLPYYGLQTVLELLLINIAGHFVLII